LSLSRYQNVAGFQIPVYDEVPVEIAGCPADFEEQSAFIPHGQPGGKNVNGLAVNIFHDEERLAVVQTAGIQHARDVRMGKRRQNLALLQKPLSLELASAEGQQLDRDTLGYVAINALGQIHSAHASAPDDFQ